MPPEAAAQGGRFNHQQARAAGLTRRQLRRAIALGLLAEVRHGVYAVSGEVLDPAATQAALARDVQLGAREFPWYAARRTAALIMGLPIIGRPPERAQMLRHRTDAHGRDRHLRIGPLPPSDTWEYGGIAMTTPARTVADIARAEPLRNALVVADAALRRGLDPVDLEAVIGRMTCWPGVRAAKQVLELASGLAESPGESVVRAACWHPDWPVRPPAPQVEIWADGLFVARVDLLIKEALLAVEFDGAVKFVEQRVLPDLLLRQELIRDAGVDVLRTFWDEAFFDPDGLRRRILERVRDRGPRTPRPGVELRPATLRLQPPLLGAPLGGLAA